MPEGLAVKTPHLILGCARSGKSAFAEKLVSCFPPPYTYIATAEVLDDEMRERVLLHRQRRDRLWETVESPSGLTGVLAGLRGKNRPVLVDCVTLWLSNLICAAAAEPEMAVDELCACIAAADYPLFLVSSETGGGIVPENPLARRFRDLAGAANQKIAQACSGVTLVVAGLPLVLK